MDSLSIAKDGTLNAQFAEGTDLWDRSVLKMLQLENWKEKGGSIVTLADDRDGTIVSLTWGTENTCSV